MPFNRHVFFAIIVASMAAATGVCVWAVAAHRVWLPAIFAAVGIYGTGAWVHDWRRTTLEWRASRDGGGS